MKVIGITTMSKVSLVKLWLTAAFATVSAVVNVWHPAIMAYLVAE